MEPSDEALAVLIGAHESRIYPAYCGLTIPEIAQLAHENAALRAEVEVLRARVAELEAETSKEITVVEARLEAQRKRLTRWTKQTNDL